MQKIKSQKTNRQKPGTTGQGKFYRIEVSPRREYITFRTQDVGKRGGLERVAGKRKTGSWGTVAWLIDKEKALVKNGKLLIKDAGVKTVLKQIKGDIAHLKGDIFTAMNIKSQATKKRASQTKSTARNTKSSNQKSRTVSRKR